MRVESIVVGVFFTLILCFLMLWSMIEEMRHKRSILSNATDLAPANPPPSPVREERSPVSPPPYTEVIGV